MVSRAKIGYRKDHQGYRFFRPDWPGDRFEVLSEDDGNKLIKNIRELLPEVAIVEFSDSDESWDDILFNARGYQLT